MKVVYIADMSKTRGVAGTLLETVCGMKNNYDVHPIVLISYSCALEKELEELGIEHYYIVHRQFAYDTDGTLWRH